MRFLNLSCVLLCAFLYASCTMGEPVVPSGEDFERAGFVALDLNEDFPNVMFMDSDENLKHMDDYLGRVVLLNFWASWCPPCVAEMPAMGRLAAELEGTDFVMLPVNVEESFEHVEKFVEEFEISFPVYFDIPGIAARDVGISSLPTSVLIDRDGRARAAVVGAIEWDDKEIIDMMKAWSR